MKCILYLTQHSNVYVYMLDFTIYLFPDLEIVKHINFFNGKL